MRSRYRIVDSEGIYFLTSTIVEWIPVFTRPRACDILVDALRHCRAHKGLRLYAYVIMENHFHLVAEAPDLSATMQSLKRHTARQIIQAAREEGRDWLLNQFRYYRLKHKVESKQQVWQEGFHPQLIQGEAMLHQKIEYVHDNPVRRGWVDAQGHWRYSSARNYLLDDASVLEIDRLDG